MGVLERFFKPIGSNNCGFLEKEAKPDQHWSGEQYPALF
jgi:hypothetical protein